MNTLIFINCVIQLSYKIFLKMYVKKVLVGYYFHNIGTFFNKLELFKENVHTFLICGTSQKVLNNCFVIIAIIM